MELFNKEDNCQLNCQNNKNNGGIDACKQCSGIDCCGVVKVGGIIEPPFLTKHDIKKIEYYTGIRQELFVQKKDNPLTGNAIYQMQSSQKNGCIFFNINDGKCTIHSFRPMDCRLFPLDIVVKENKYYWALFRYARCNTLSKKDLDSLLEYREEALRILDDDVLDYATVPVPGMDKIGYKILMEIRS